MTINAPLLAALFAAAPSVARAYDNPVLADHIRESYRFPSDVEIKFGDPKPSEVAGFDVMDVHMSRGQASQSDKLYVSKDGKHYIMGGFRDLDSNPDQERLSKMDLKGSAARGPSKAPVLVVQYTDFQCPYCQKGYEVMRNQIMKEYPEKVRWVYKSLPLTTIHPWAERAAVAAECVKDQGQAKFWQVHDSLFEAQRQVNAANLDQKLQDFAKAAKVDAKVFLACYDAKKTLPFVRRDAAEAEALGINGTPAFLINGHLVPGADYEAIKQVIDEVLKGKHGKLIS